MGVPLLSKGTPIGEHPYGNKNGKEPKAKLTNLQNIKPYGSDKNKNSFFFKQFESFAFLYG